MASLSGAGPEANSLTELLLENIDVQTAALIAAVGGGDEDADAYEALAVAGTVVVLTAATYLTATNAIITVEDASLRFTLDGTAPAASGDGHLVQVGGIIRLNSAADIASFIAIRETATSSAIKVTYS